MLFIRASNLPFESVAGKMPPNIIFILSDQHNASLISAWGDPYARTPNLDRLASGGSSLTNAYCGSPLCAPSRMSMLACQLPTKTGVFTNFQTLRSDRPTFVHGLTAAGYETVLCGRMHFTGPDQRHGYRERLVGDFTAVALGIDLEMGELDGTTDQKGRVLIKSGPGRSSVMAYDRDVTEAACRLISAHPKSQPLFATVGLYGPHCPFVCPRDLFAHYYETLPEPQPPSAFAENAHPAIRKWFENRDMLDVPAEAVRRSRAAYYGVVELMDGYVGEILEAVEQHLGLEETVIVYASDHGEMNGEHGMFWKSNFYEGSARVPIIYHWPAQIAAGGRIDTPTSLMDLGSTFLSLAGASALPDPDGRDIAPVLTGKEPPDADRAVISILGDVKGDNPSAMVRKDCWKLVAHHDYAHPQLFDMAADPGENDDLGQDPEYERQRNELLFELGEHWDGKAVWDYVQGSRAHIEQIREANRYLNHDLSEQWDSQESFNRLEEWP